MTIARNYRGGNVARDSNFDYLPPDVWANMLHGRRTFRRYESVMVEAFDAAPDIDWHSETETTPEPDVFGWDDVEPGDQLHVTFDDGTEIVGIAHVWAKGRWRTPDDHPLGGPESRGFQSLRLVRRAVTTTPGTIIRATIVGSTEARTLVFRGSHIGWQDMHTREVVIGPDQNEQFTRLQVVYDPDADIQNLGA